MLRLMQTGQRANQKKSEYLQHLSFGYQKLIMAWHWQLKVSAETGGNSLCSSLQDVLQSCATQHFQQGTRDSATCTKHQTGTSGTSCAFSTLDKLHLRCYVVTAHRYIESSIMASSTIQKSCIHVYKRAGCIIRQYKGIDSGNRDNSSWWHAGPYSVLPTVENMFTALIKEKKTDFA